MKLKIEREKVLESTKIVLGIGAAVGVGIIVGAAIKTIPMEKQTLVAKVCVGIGTVVLQSMASDAAMKYVGEQVDEIGTYLEELDQTLKLVNTVSQLNNEDSKEE